MQRMRSKLSYVTVRAFWSAKMIDILYFRGFASPFMHCNSDDVKIASPATKTNYISMMSRQSFDQVNELTWLIFLE